MGEKWERPGWEKEFYSRLESEIKGLPPGKRGEAWFRLLAEYYPCEEKPARSLDENLADICGRKLEPFVAYETAMIYAKENGILAVQVVRAMRDQGYNPDILGKVMRVKKDTLGMDLNKAILDVFTHNLPECMQAIGHTKHEGNVGDLQTKIEVDYMLKTFDGVSAYEFIAATLTSKSLQRQINIVIDSLAMHKRMNGNKQILTMLGFKFGEALANSRLQTKDKATVFLELYDGDSQTAKDERFIENVMKGLCKQGERIHHMVPYLGLHMTAYDLGRLMKNGGYEPNEIELALRSGWHHRIVSEVKYQLRI